MAHNITELDAGLLAGNEPTWHGLTQYKLMGDVPITADDVKRLVDYDIRTQPLFVQAGDGFTKTGNSFAVCRVLPDGNLYPLCRAVGRKYSVLPRKEIINAVDVFLMQKFSSLKFAGAGTFGGGQTFFFQLKVEDYHVKGDQSDHELRLTYSDTYGESSHRVGCTSVRVVCNNTLRAGWADAVARNMFSAIRHTSGAVGKVEAKLEEFAQIHLHLVDEIALLEQMTEKSVDTKTLDNFLDQMFPTPVEPEKHVVTVNRMNKGREKVTELFERSGETMDSRISTSAYALLQAYTDYSDHYSYYRDPGLRWQEGISGPGADRKDKAKELLLAV